MLDTSLAKWSSMELLTEEDPDGQPSIVHMDNQGKKKTNNHKDN